MFHVLTTVNLLLFSEASLALAEPRSEKTSVIDDVKLNTELET